MKLAILSCSPNAYSTRRLKEAAEQRGHEAKVLNTLKFAIDLERGSPDLYFRQKAFKYIRCGVAENRRIDYLLRHGSGQAVSGDGRVLRQYRPRHHQFPRQAAQLTDTEPAPRRPSQDDVCAR